LQDAVKTAGTEVSGDGIIETFHNDDEAPNAVDNGVVVCIFFYARGLVCFFILSARLII